MAGYVFNGRRIPFCLKTCPVKQEDFIMSKGLFTEIQGHFLHKS